MFIQAPFLYAIIVAILFTILLRAAIIIELFHYADTALVLVFLNGSITRQALLVTFYIVPAHVNGQHRPSGD